MHEEMFNRGAEEEEMFKVRETTHKEIFKWGIQIEERLL